MATPVSSPSALNQHPTMKRPEGPVVVVVADGVGHAPAADSNAVTRANTPTLDALLAEPLSTTIAAHGPAVGLPTDDDMGNSEVGHNAIGAGRIFAQGAKLVNAALDNGTIWETETWRTAMEHGRQNTLHFIGLLSDGNVHSNTAQLYRLLNQAADEGVTRCRLHILLDGRDVAPRSAQTYIEDTEKVLALINADHNVDFAIASGGGRMTITMDRYGADWPMIERGYRNHVYGEGRQFPTAADAVDTYYEETEDGDQYLDTFVITKPGSSDQPIGTIEDGDAVILWNFRGDRAIEISQAFEQPDGDMPQIDRTAPDGTPPPKVFFAGLLQYDGDLNVPMNYLVDPPAIENTMGQYLADAGLSCFAVSETQKFGHVTYFWNGNRSGYLNESLETYVEVPSDSVPFDQAPAMKAAEITDEVIKLLETGRYAWGRLNYANGDMVGHTGDLPATIASMEALDVGLSRLLKAVDDLGGIVIFTADHGNADIMYDEKDGVRTPKTSHTLSSVPFVVHCADPSAYELADVAEPGLANIAATVISLLGFEPPADYLPSLISSAE